MLLDTSLFLSLTVYTVVCALKQDTNLVNSNELQGSEEIMHKTKSNNTNIPPKLQDKSFESERVSIELYYETLCPYSEEFYTTTFAVVVEKLNPYLNISTYPYGNAETIERNGEYTFKCQHGPEECYGNKLHACAIDVLQNITQAVLFNSCVMKKGDDDSNEGSNDKGVDACGEEQSIDSNPIKECAKGTKGNQLLKEHGDATKNMNIHRVPWVYINGNQDKHRSKFMNNVCAAFTCPPPPCHKKTKKHHHH